MEYERIDALTDIDWDDDFVWVQRAPSLTVVGQEHRVVRVRHPLGLEYSLSRAEVERHYCRAREGRLLQPRQAPQKAHCAGRMVMLDVDGECVALGDGDAIINDEGRISVVRARIYSRDYTAVAYQSAPERSAAPLPVAV